MSKLEVDAIEPQSGTTITIGASGDTVNLVGTLNSNGSPLPGDISEVIAGTGLSGGGQTGAVTINIEAAQPTITSLGTITSFRSTGIDDNSNALAMTIDSSENVGIKNTTMASFSNLPATDLVVGSGSTHSGITIYSSASSGSNIAFADGASGDARNQGIIQYHHNGDYMRFFTSASEKMRILSAGNVGIGTSSPSATVGTDKVLEIAGSVSPGLVINDTGQAEKYQLYADSTKFKINYGSTNFLTYNASGSFLGIGTVTPAATLTVNDAGGAFMQLERTGQGHLFLSTDGTNGTIRTSTSNGALRFQTNGNNERMRIDSSGNVYIGKTSGVIANVGHEFNAGSYASHTRASDVVLYLNRTTDDGTIAEFRGDNTAVASVRVRSDFGVFEFGTLGTGIGGTSSHSWLPMVNNVRSNNQVSLGQASYKMTELFATNGTINTSDQNEKQSIQSLTTAEMNVGKKLSSLIKTYKWNSSVEEKGDNARTHTGIIAQDVQQAFNDEGLDASKYSLWCSDTWSIDADGERIENPEEEIENNPTKNILGIRYDQLLSFIQAYNDQRFTELEARITTLENA